MPVRCLMDVSHLTHKFGRKTSALCHMVLCLYTQMASSHCLLLLEHQMAIGKDLLQGLLTEIGTKADALQRRRSCIYIGSHTSGVGLTAVCISAKVPPEDVPVMRSLCIQQSALPCCYNGPLYDLKRRSMHLRLLMVCRSR